MTRDSRFSNLGAARPSVAQGGGAYAGLGKRATRAGTMIDNSELFDFRKVNNEMNILKMEEQQRQKIQRIKNSGSDYQRIIFEMISSSKFQNTIMCCVFINILLLISKRLPENAGDFFQRQSTSMETVDAIFLAVYVVEMLLKMYVYHTDYFKGWDLLDFVIVCFSIVDVGQGIYRSMLKASASTNAGGGSSMKSVKLIRLLRATRMLRVLRTLKFIERLQRYAITIIKAVKSLGAILKLMGPVLFIFAAVGCSIFGEILPRRFGNMSLTMFTLIQLITLDDWYEIVQEASVEHEDLHGTLFLFIMSYIFIMVFICFNLLIAVLVDNFQLSMEENRAKLNHQKAQTTNTLEQLEAIESDEDDSDDGGFLDNLMNDDVKLKKKDLDDEEEFVDYFSDVPPSQLMLLQWYYRIMPAVEKQLFNYNDQMSSYETIIEEAITQSDEMFTAR